MKPLFYLRYLARESRSLKGRLLFFVLCLTIGVAAVVGVAAVSETLDNGIRANARKLLAADLDVSARRPIPDEIDVLLKELGAVETARTRETAAMIVLPERAGRAKTSRLVELKVVEPGYPFYGQVIADPPLASLRDLGVGEVLAGAELFETLRVSIGDEVRIGQGTFRIKGRIVEEPDRVEFSMLFGPRILMSAAGFETTGMGTSFSRARYRVLAKFAPGTTPRELNDIRDELRRRAKGGSTLDVDTYVEAQPALRDSLDRMASYLGLVALISLVLGGVGIAETVRTWLLSRLDAIAVVRALGMRPSEVFRLYLVQVFLIALIGCVIGISLGSTAPWILSRIVPELVPKELVSVFLVGASVRGLLIGLVIALVFAAPPLLALRRVPCARVLRHNAEPVPASRFSKCIAAALVALGVFVAAGILTGNWKLAGAFTGALAAMALVLAAAVRLFLLAAAAFPRRYLSATSRWGLASLSRPEAGTTAVLLALGLGVFVVTTLFLVRTQLLDRLQSVLPDRAPSVFFADIQPDQWEGISTRLETFGAQGVDAVPVATARLSAIDGIPVEEIAESRKNEKGRARWVLTREQRLTWYPVLPESNRLVEGELWNDASVLEVSLEEKYARDLGVKLGSMLQFDVQGVPFEFKLTSLRRITWESFAINFFIAVEPGALESSPHFILAAARVDGEKEAEMQNVVSDTFPNVTVVRIRAIVERVSAVVAKLATGVESVGLVTFLAGLAILAGAIAAQTLRRRTEIAILKTVGATRLQILKLLGLEFGLLGALAAAVGGAGAFVAGYFFVDRVLDVPPDLPYTQLLVIVPIGAIATALVGLLACRSVLRTRPLEILRS